MNISEIDDQDDDCEDSLSDIPTTDKIEEELLKDLRNFSDSGFFKSDDEINEYKQTDSINGNSKKNEEEE